MFPCSPSMRHYDCWVRPRDWVIAALIVVAAGVAVVYGAYYFGARRIAFSVRTHDLQVGECIREKTGSVLPEHVKRARCDGPHFGEVFAILTVPDTQDYPGEEAVKRFGDNCGRKFFEYAPEIPEGPTFRVAVGYPRAQAWANGDRTVVCAAMSKGERWSSVRADATVAR
jgi:hypothetical protein